MAVNNIFDWVLAIAQFTAALILVLKITWAPDLVLKILAILLVISGLMDIFEE